MRDDSATPSPEPLSDPSPGSETEAQRDDTSGPATDDDHLILWMLGLTSTERLNVAQGFVDSVFALRNGRRA